MKEKLITLAVHTLPKAKILKQVLENNGVLVFLENLINESQSAGFSSGVYVRIREEDLTKALSLIEENRLFNYSDEQTRKIDDGKGRVLVAVDFSDYSLKACHVAFNVAKSTDSKVKILHVYRNLYFPSHIPFADSLKEKDDIGPLDRARKQMLDLCYEIEKRIKDGEFPSVNYSYSIREGNIADEIDNFVKEYQPQLLVVGTKGIDNSSSNILGNVTADIIEMTNVPVLAVPKDLNLNELLKVRHIAFLTNFHERDLASFHTLVHMIKPAEDVKITLLHMNAVNKKGEKHSEEELQRMKEYFLNNFPHLQNVDYKLIDAPDMLLAINDYIKESRVGVVVLNTQRRSLFGRLFLPSVSRKILTKLKVGVLILRG